MNKLEKAKEIIKENYNAADCGIYNTRNYVGDPMYNIYDEDMIPEEVAQKECLRYCKDGLDYDNEDK